MGRNLHSVSKTLGATLGTASCTGMIAITFSSLLGLLGLSAALTFLAFIDRLLRPIAAPLLLVSLGLILVGAYRSGLLAVTLTALGGLLAYAGMFLLPLGGGSMSGMGGADSVVVFWLGVGLIVGSFVAGQTSGRKGFLQERPTVAFVLSLVGGILILLGGMVMSAFGMVFMPMGQMYDMGSRMGHMDMGGMMGMMMLMGSGGIVGIVAGVLVIIGAVMIYTNPDQRIAWSTIIILFSVLSILGGMGGFVVGLALGLAGGVLALTWTPRPSDQNPGRQA